MRDDYMKFIRASQITPFMLPSLSQMQAPGGGKAKQLFLGEQGIHAPRTDGRIQLIICNYL